MVHEARLLPGAGLLIACLLFGSAQADDVVKFVSPKPGDLLFETTTFKLAVEEIDPPVDRVDLYVDGVLIGSVRAPDWSLKWNAGPDAESSEVLAVAFADSRMIAKARLSSTEAPWNEYELVDLVQLYPVVTDDVGGYIRDLEADDFRVFENDVRVEVEHFSSEVQSLSLVLILDVSGSMAGKLGQLQVAASRFVDRLKETDEVALYAFDHATRMLSDLTLDHETVKEQIWELSPGGGTALYDAVVKTIGENLRYVPGRKAVFVFSDGQDRHSFASLDRVVRMASDHSVMIYTVGSGEDEASMLAREDLTALATQTGGKAYFIRRARQLEDVFGAIIDDLRAQYVLSYRPPAGTEGIRKIRIDEAHARRSSGTQGKIVIRHRKSYYYRPPESE
ncbi:MAG: VWA domain-containing protein [Acidobacteriota bacterium]|nr:VWA domain-containing protein [Acidobacteriota bacterium]